MVGWVMADHWVDYDSLRNIVTLDKIEKLLKNHDLIIVIDSKPRYAIPEAHSNFLVKNEKILGYGKNIEHWSHLDVGLFFGKRDTILNLIEELYEKDFDTKELLELKVYLLDVQGKVTWFGINTPEEYKKLLKIINTLS